MALFDPADFGGGNGWLSFEDRWGPIKDALAGGQFDPQGSNNLPPPGHPQMSNAQMFPGYGTNMGGEAAGGPQMLQEGPPQGMPPQGQMPPPAPLVMPSLGGMAPQGRPPDIGDRIQAAGAGFFNAGSPMQAIGNLIGGAITGQRQDPTGIAAQVYGQQQAITQQSQAAAMEYVRQDPSIPQPMKLAMLRQPALAMKYVAEMAKPPKYEFQKVDPGQTAGYFAPPQGGVGPTASLVQQGGGMKPGEVSELRKEVGGLPEVKRYAQALPIYRSMAETIKRNDPAGDLDFVYGVAKIFDPDSVVREGEMVIVRKLQNLPEEVRGWLSSVVTGGGKLTPEVRRRILDVARTRIGELKGATDERIKPYEGIADRNKVNRKDIMPGFQDLPEPLPSQAAATQEAREKIKTGVPRAIIIKRMIDMGYSVEGL